MESIRTSKDMFSITSLYGAVKVISSIDITERIQMSTSDHCYYACGDKKLFCTEYSVNNYLVKRVNPLVKLINAEIVVLYCNPIAYHRRSGSIAGRCNHYMDVSIRLEFDTSSPEVKEFESITCSTIEPSIDVHCIQIKESTEEGAYVELQRYYESKLGFNPLVTNKELNLKVFSKIYTKSLESKYHSVSDYKLKTSIGEFDIAINKACDKLIEAGFISVEEKSGDNYNFKVYKPTQKGIERMNKVLD